jgi:hypothetical protein
VPPLNKNLQKISFHLLSNRYFTELIRIRNFVSGRKTKIRDKTIENLQNTNSCYMII